MSLSSILASFFGKVFLGFALLSSTPPLTPPPVLHFGSSPFFHFSPTLTIPIPTLPKAAQESESKEESAMPTPLPEKPVVAAETPKPKPAASAAAPKSPPVEPPPAPSAPVNGPIPAPSPQVPVGTLNTSVREALVNILCTTGGAGPLKPISGSGIMVDSRGVILTNAHVAQFMLLKDYPTAGNVDCVVRTGSPARTMYKAQLLYFPRQWLAANAHKIRSENPTGTGEHDFALLYITGTTDPNASLPASFPHLPMDAGQSIDAAHVLLAAYPAGFLGGASIQTNLYIASAQTTVGQVFTFNEGGGADLFSVGGTILSQKGSSGGAVVREQDTRLIGLIATATLAESTSDRDLRAISIHHIDQSIFEDTGAGLAQLLSGDVSLTSRAFMLTRVPTLTQTLVEALEH